MPRTNQQYEEIRNEKRNLIMDVALRLFANEGYYATSISRIAKEAGISKGLMYNYFESKESLFRMLLRRQSDEILDIMNPDHDDEITVNEAMNFFDKYFDMLKQHREEMRLYFQVSMQPNVIEMLTDEHRLKEGLKMAKLQLKFFDDHFEGDPQLWFLEWTSLTKGFALQYTFAPEMFSDKLLDEFKAHIKDRFFKHIIS